MPARTDRLQTYRGIGLLGVSLLMLVAVLYGTGYAVTRFKESLRPTVLTTREVRVVYPEEISDKTGPVAKRALEVDTSRDLESRFTQVVAPYFRDGKLVSVLHAEKAFQERGSDKIRLENFTIWEFSEDGQTARKMSADRGKYDRETGDMEAHGHVRARKYRLPEGAPDPRTTPE